MIARVKLNHRLLPGLMVVLLFLQLVVPYQGWTIFLVGLGGAWLVAFLWVRALARGLTLTREIRFGWAQVGDRLEERFTLANTGWAPALWVEILDHSTLPGYVPSRATGVGGETENSWIVKALCTRRGIFTLGPTTVRAGDPFGIYTLTLDYPATANMVVMPPVVRLPGIQVAPGGRIGEGSRRANTFERTVNAAMVRDYAPGDSWSWMHWRTTAHHDALFVRQFESTPASDWWIMLDLEAGAQAGQGENSTTEHGIILAASLADRGLRARRAVGLIVAGTDFVWLPPREGDAQHWEILRALAVVTPGTRPLAEILPQMGPAFHAATSLIVITPAAHGDWISSLLPLRWRGIVPTVLLLDPASFGGSGSANAAAAMLTDLEMAHYMITREVLDRPERRPGHAGEWDWQVGARGRAIAKRAPRETAWKPLGQ